MRISERAYALAAEESRKHMIRAVFVETSHLAQALDEYQREQERLVTGLQDEIRQIKHALATGPNVGILLR